MVASSRRRTVMCPLNVPDFPLRSTVAIVAIGIVHLHGPKSSSSAFVVTLNLGHGFSWT